tara:strand:+ start:8536 stop:9276 length:741 start_codon:yes stop_codon:yes gene_type:complete
MKLAIVTRCEKNYKFSSLSHPILKEYASMCGADFIIISERKINIGPFHNEIFQCYELLDYYDRICVIDSDVLLNNPPNIFKLVPYDKIGLVFEDIGFRKKDRLRDILLVQKKFGNVDWKRGYLNSGFIVFSKVHKDIFKINKKYFWNKIGFDDVQIGYMINKLNYKIFELPYKFNHVSLFSEAGKNWLKSYVIHYGGRGFYRKLSRFEQMKRDLYILNYKSNLYISFANILPRIRLVLLGLIGYLK